MDANGFTVRTGSGAGKYVWRACGSHTGGPRVRTVRVFGVKLEAFGFKVVRRVPLGISTGMQPKMVLIRHREPNDCEQD
jgi:hypothetical protein